MENSSGLLLFTPCIIRSLNHIHQEKLTRGLERVSNPVACIFWSMWLLYTGADAA